MAVVKGEDAPKQSRRDKAKATRLRMTRAAHEVFVERGYAGARMNDIAEVAGVAVQTLYFTFHTKAELLQACYDRAVLGDEDPLPPPAQPWYAAMVKARSGRSALKHFVDGNTNIAARVAELDDIVRSTLHEPDAVRIRANSEHLRRVGYRGIVEHLASTFGLRRGVDLDRATDVLLMFGSGSVYRQLVVDYGWPDDRFRAWLTDTLVSQLLGV